jgi:hypothetical protein
MLQQPMWSQQVRACAPAVSPGSGSCKSDEVFVALPMHPSRLCIMSPGEMSCPANSIYSQSETAYSEMTFLESRACSKCTCDPPTGGSCSFPLMPPSGYAYSDSTCRTNFLTPFTFFAVPTGCQPFAGVAQPEPYFKLVFDAGLDPGHCSPDGGQATGTATPDGRPFTFCCTP